MKFKLSLVLYLLSFVLLSGFLTSTTFAGVLELKMIGIMSTQGKTYSEWWYSLANPKLSGTTAESVDVTVTANGTAYETISNTEGEWELLLPLATGDHNIKIEADDESYSFILHLGQTMPSSGSTSTTTSSTTTPVPATGLNQTVAINLALGLTFLAAYLYFFGEKNHIISFEKEIKNR